VEGYTLKTLIKIAGGVLVLLIVLLVIFRITGLNPNERRPGLWLTGDLVTTPVTDWSFTDRDFTLQIQTHGAYLLPHSVTTYCATLNHILYVGSSNPPVREWNKDVARDPHVRLRIDNKLYDVKLVPVTDATEFDAVMQNRQKKYPNYKQPQGTKFILFRAEPDS
jgi:hypothetical protein